MKLKKKSKTFLLLFLVLFVMVLLIGGILFYLKQNEKKKVEEIKRHYASSVVMNSGSIYEKNEQGYEIVGEVKMPISLYLSDTEISSSEETFFSVKDTDYYVSYQSVTPKEEIKTLNIPDYYYSKEVITSKDVTNFYNENNLLFTISKPLSFDVIYTTEQSYVVSFLGDSYELKKEEADVSDTKEILESERISVISVPEVKDGCADASCITKEKVKEFLSKFQEKEMYSISKNDYELWAGGNVHLKKGAVLFVSGKAETLTPVFEEMKERINEIGEWKLSGNDMVTAPPINFGAISNYTLSQVTSEEHLNKMINGETIEKPKPVTTTTHSLPSLNAKATNIPVLNYHFFYGDGESCGQNICLHIDKFREQLQFLKDNQYKTLTMEEYRSWMYGEIELPARSVLLTVDDGAKGTGTHNGNKLIPLLEEYNMHATLFLISGWWPKSNYLSNNLDIESHTYDMHTEGLCSTESRGAKLLCSSKEQVMEDLKKSIQMVGSSKAFCFPFYAYNDSAIASVKEAGFKLAFIGGNRKSNRSNDKYKIPRYPIYDSTSLKEFINMIA